MDNLLLDLRDAVRVLRRNTAYTATVAVILAVGIAANATIFSVVHGMLLKPLPYDRAEDLAMIWADLGDGGQSLPAVSPLDFRDFPDMSQLFEEFTAATSGRIAGFSGALTGGDAAAELIDVGGVSHNFFPMLGVDPMIGRHIEPTEDLLNGPRVAMISYELWQRRYGGDRALVGQTIAIDDVDHEVIAILPKGFRLHLPAEAFLLKHSDVWVPVQFDYENSRPRNWTFYSVFGRKKADATWPEVQADMNAVAAELRARHSEHAGADTRLRAVPLHQDVVKTAQPAVLALFGAVGFLLLIVCANVASLTLVRGASRRRELAIQAAFGAPRGRIVRRLLTESLIVAGLAALLALALTRGALALLATLRPAGLPRLADISLDPNVIAFTGGAALLTAILFGLIPALIGGRVDLVSALGSGRTTGGRQAHRLRRFFVIAELALALVLLIGLGLMIQSFSAVVETRPGFDSEGLLTFRMELPRQRYAEEETRRALYDQIAEDLAALPGVRSVAATSQLPLTGSGSLAPYAYDEKTAQNWESVTAEGRPATPGFLATMGTRLLAGRDFTASDLEPDAAPVVIIDEFLARKVWGDQSPIGQRLQVRESSHDTPFAEVVGVSEHIRMLDLAQPGREVLIRPMASWFRRSWVMRADGDPEALAPAVRQVIARLDPDLPVANLVPMSTYVNAAADPARFSVLLMSIFGGIALLLAGLGIASVIALGVGERRRELAIRLALGEMPEELVHRFLREGLGLAAIAAVLGLVVALLMGRLLTGLLVGVAPTDPVTLLTVTAFMLAAALAACFVPARRAARVEPSSLLRADG